MFSRKCCLSLAQICNGSRSSVDFSRPFYFPVFVSLCSHSTAFVFSLLSLSHFLFAHFPTLIIIIFFFLPFWCNYSELAAPAASTSGSRLLFAVPWSLACKPRRFHFFFVPFLCALNLSVDALMQSLHTGYFWIIWSCAIHFKFLKRISAEQKVLRLSGDCQRHESRWQVSNILPPCVCLEIMTRPDRHLRGAERLHSLAPSDAASLCSKESSPNRAAPPRRGSN